jgi:hypothetical protein
MFAHCALGQVDGSGGSGRRAVFGNGKKDAEGGHGAWEALDRHGPEHRGKKQNRVLSIPK